MKKEELRKKYILIRNRVENKTQKSEIISEKIQEQIEYKNAKIIALYKNLKSEVSTEKLIEDSINLGKCVALSKVVNIL